MRRSILTRYLDSVVINRLAEQAIEPSGMVVGNLAGAHASPLSGFAVEFAGHREYAPGDDPKFIDWRVYFSREKLFVKQYEMETNFVCHLLLDASASMNYGQGPTNKFDFARRIAATLAYAVVRQRDRVSLAVFDDAVRGAVPPGNALDQTARVVQLLEQLEPNRPSDFAACLNELAKRTRRREMVVLVSDFLGDLDALENALQLMRFHGHEVVLLHLLHPDEAGFNFRGLVEFDGLESDVIEATDAADVRSAFLEALGAFQNRLREICLRNDCELATLDTGLQLHVALLRYFDQRAARQRSRRL